MDLCAGVGPRWCGPKFPVGEGRGSGSAPRTPVASSSVLWCCQVGTTQPMNPEDLLDLYGRSVDSPTVVPRLLGVVLDLAVSGELVKQDTRKGLSTELLRQIAAAKNRQMKQRRTKRQGDFAPATYPRYNPANNDTNLPFTLVSLSQQHRIVVVVKVDDLVALYDRLQSALRVASKRNLRFIESNFRELIEDRDALRDTGDL